MELCDHLKKYYKSEILNGNDVLSVDVNYYEKIILAIHFTKPLSEKNKIKIHEDNCVETEDILLPFWPSQTYIYCKPCKMALSFPYDEKGDWYEPSHVSDTPDERGWYKVLEGECPANPLIIASLDTLTAPDDMKKSVVKPTIKYKSKK